MIIKKHQFNYNTLLEDLIKLMKRFNLKIHHIVLSGTKVERYSKFPLGD